MTDAPSPARTDREDPILGQVIGGYRLLRVLGAGGMGVVYEAIDVTIGKRAAIKLLHPHFSQNPRFATRFVNEARAVNLVEHPGLVTIFSYGQLPNGTAYLVMEYLEGATLKEHLRGAGAKGLPLKEALLLLRQLAEALTAAHEKGVIHRDLKPENIMLVAGPTSAEGSPGAALPKVLDFGVAKLAFEASAEGAHTETDALLGTPQYMSPEQCLGAGHVDDRADVYSLGVIAYQMLSGRLPFIGEGKGALLLMHMTQPPPPLRSRAPHVPAVVSDLLRRMLAKQREDRPRMAQVVTAIRGFEQGHLRPPLPRLLLFLPLAIVALVLLALVLPRLRSRPLQTQATAADLGSPSPQPDLGVAIALPDLLEPTIASPSPADLAPRRRTSSGQGRGSRADAGQPSRERRLITEPPRGLITEPPP